MENQPGEFWLEGLFLGWIQKDEEEIRALNLENKLYQELREKHADDPETVMMCREILFLHSRMISQLMERINDAKNRIKAIPKRPAEELS